MSESIKIADKSDVKIIAELAKELWPNHDLDDLTKEFGKLLALNETYIVLKYVDALPIGFA